MPVLEIIEFTDLFYPSHLKLPEVIQSLTSNLELRLIPFYISIVYIIKYIYPQNSLFNNIED